jgi:vanillate/4-hydroxybenzoate decarboxylase subunit C
MSENSILRRYGAGRRNLPQVIWALAVTVTPEFEAISSLRMVGNSPAPSSDLQGLTTRLVLDATTPTQPDRCGDNIVIHPYPQTADWERELRKMLK